MKKIIIIAEAGVNHNGNLKMAKKFIDAAVYAKADFVKFQTFVSENLVTKNASKAYYQINNLKNKKITQYEMLKKLELSENDHVELINYCKNKHIKFLSSVFDLESFKLLNKLKLRYIKIPSSEINNYPLLKELSKFKKKYILSTGMASLREIKDNLSILTSGALKNQNIYLMHCNSDYPTKFSDVNLRVINNLKKKFKCKIGFSDHSLGIEAPIASAALEVEIIEKHITIDQNFKGPDHKISLTPKQFKLMVKCIRNVEIAMGTANKKATYSEIKNIPFIRKSNVAKKYIKKGDVLSENNLAVKRPGNGITPKKWNKIIGKKAKKNYEPDMLI